MKNDRPFNQSSVYPSPSYEFPFRSRLVSSGFSMVIPLSVGLWLGLPKIGERIIVV